VKSSSSSCDVVIAGGGMVGLTLALAIARGGLEVALAEPLLPEQFLDERFDGRVSALAFASVRMLRVLGLWDRLQGDAQPISDILVSEGGRVGVLRPSRFISIMPRSASRSAASSKTGICERRWARCGRGEAHQDDVGRGRRRAYRCTRSRRAVAFGWRCS